MGSPMTRCSNPRGAVRASRPPDRELHGGECLGDVKFTSSAFNLPRMRVVVLENEHKDFCEKRTDVVGRSA